MLLTIRSRIIPRCAAPFAFSTEQLFFEHLDHTTRDAADCLNTSERKLCETLTAFKAQADARILQNAQLLNNPAFTEREMLRPVAQQFSSAGGFTLDAAGLKELNNLILKECLDEFGGQVPA